MDVGSKLQRQMMIGIVGIAAAVVTYHFYQTLSPRSKPSLPGPKPSDSAMGNFGDMGAAGSLHQYLAQLTSEHGCIGAFWWGPVRVAYITSLRVLLDERNSKLLNSSNRPSFLFDGFKPLVTEHSIQYVNGSEFEAKFHNVWMAAYQRNMTSKIVAMTKVTAQIMDKWTEKLDEESNGDSNSNSNGIEVNMMDETFEFASKSVIYASFGSNVSDDICADVVKGYNGAWHEMEKRLIDGIPSDAERDAEFERNINTLSDAVRSILKQQGESNNTSNGNIEEHSFLHCITQQKELYDSEDKILGEAITAIVGGSHTTGTALTWLLYYISRNKEIQQKLYDEIKHFFNVKQPFDGLKVDDISKKLKRLMYCKQVITESLRLSALAPWAARVNEKEDMTLNLCHGKGGTVTIPKGTAFIIGQGVALHDENVFENAKEFNPDRWSRRNVKGNKILQQSQNAVFGGLGGRMCPGWAFFRTEALIFMVAAVTQFRFEMVTDKAIGTKYGLVASPVEPVRIRITKRV